MPICKLITHQDPRFHTPGVGKFFDENSYRDIYDYTRGLHRPYNEQEISRKEKMPSDLHGSRGLDYYRAPEEMESVARAFGKYEGTKVRHYLLSLSPEECGKLGGNHYLCCLALQDMAERFLDCFHGEYQCYYTIHEDTEHPHAHICCSTVNYLTGKKYPGDRKSYFGLQNEMNSFLHQEYGMHLHMIPDEA